MKKETIYIEKNICTYRERNKEKQQAQQAQKRALALF